MKEEVFNLFLNRGAPPVEQLQRMASTYLQAGKDFAEIYLENVASKGYRLSERIISEINSSQSCGAGIRVIRGEHTGYSYTEDLAAESIDKCLKEANRIAGSTKALSATGFTGKNAYYPIPSSIPDASVKKIDILRRAEERAFSLCPLVKKVEVSLTELDKTVSIVNSLGVLAWDIRPMLIFSVSVVLEKEGRRERAYQGGGGRIDLSYFDDRPPEQFAYEAVNQALILLEAKPAPAGEMEVVLGAGESGILLHESIGHPLEADINFRGSSAFTGKIGQKVATDQCTIVDQATIPFQRGSLNVDDEGNDTGATVLIEKGVLRSYMYDLITGSHFHTAPANGRRESFRYLPIPRMTNTFMMAGEYDPEEIIRSVKKGVFAKTFSGGQVDISSGDFVFSITEGYMIEDGKIAYPIKGATLIGNGPEILKRVVMVGNDLVISDGKWTCGKEGQSVPVGVGMPTVKLSHITVGGTEHD